MTTSIVLQVFYQLTHHFLASSQAPEFYIRGFLVSSQVLLFYIQGIGTWSINLMSENLPGSDVESKYGMFGNFLGSHVSIDGHLCQHISTVGRCRPGYAYNWTSGHLELSVAVRGLIVAMVKIIAIKIFFIHIILRVVLNIYPTYDTRLGRPICFWSVHYLGFVLFLHSRKVLIEIDLRLRTFLHTGSLLETG